MGTLSTPVAASALRGLGSDLICSGLRAQTQLRNGGPGSPISWVPPPEVFLGLLAGPRPLPSPYPQETVEGPEVCVLSTAGVGQGTAQWPPCRSLAQLVRWQGTWGWWAWPPSSVAPGWLVRALPHPRSGPHAGPAAPGTRKPRPQVCFLICKVGATAGPPHLPLGLTSRGHCDQQ